MTDYILIPKYTTINEIINNDYSLSATRYKTFNIKNKNIRTVEDFLKRKLKRTDLGSEIGSFNYVDNSNYKFIKTKALQEESYLINDGKDSIISISNKEFIDMKLKKNDVIISKDSNVGEVIILHEDMPNAMLCGGLYRLPIKEHKMYLLAFLKSELYRQQIDFLIPRGSTIRHGKTEFLKCKIPMPKSNPDKTIAYIELLMRSIINKETEIRRKYNKILSLIQKELEDNQKNMPFNYQLPTIDKIMEFDRMDSSLYTKKFKKKEFLIKNYTHGISTLKQLGFNPSRGQNLQITQIGISQFSNFKVKNYYRLKLPKYISKYGTITHNEYIGNKNKLKTVNLGEIIFGAEGNEKGRSFVVLDEEEQTVTNIHGITFKNTKRNLTDAIFVKLFLDYLRSLFMIDAYAVGGNGGSLAIKYLNFLPFPNFPNNKKEKITKLYHNPTVNYKIIKKSFQNFVLYDKEFNKVAGVYDLDKSLQQIKQLLSSAIESIADDKIPDFWVCF